MKVKRLVIEIPRLITRQAAQAGSAFGDRQGCDYQTHFRVWGCFLEPEIRDYKKMCI